MKTILVPTDFSAVSVNAINYAVEIAKISNAKIILFNAYHLPIITSEVPIILPLDEMKQSTMDRLKKIESQIRSEFDSQFSIECNCSCGFPVQEINIFAQENKVDMIIMGMEGASYLEEKFVGSTTTSVISSSKVPVLAINKNVKFHSIKKIVFACDFSQMNDLSAIDTLKELSDLFKAQIFVLNVVHELETVPSVSKAIEGIKLNHLFKDIEHSFHSIQNEDIIDGINDFVNEKEIDLVMMIPRMHTLLRSIFSEPNTKRMAFHTKVPLLTLIEK